MNHIIGWFTDAKNRPEIKAVLGVFCVLAAFVISILWLFIKLNVQEALLIFGTFFGAGLSLLGITAIADAKNDSAEKAA
jgi:hypothetical protein